MHLYSREQEGLSMEMFQKIITNPIDFSIPGICGMGLHFTLDGFRLIYVAIAVWMWGMTLIFSGDYMKHHDNKARYYVFTVLTFAATVGVFLSADLFTTFIFFEIMSFTSYVWVAQEETKEALRAANTYLAVAVIGGLVMLMGIFLLYHSLGTVMIKELLAAATAYPDKKMMYAAGTCLLFGFGAKAGAFPLHIWLPKAHPVAPAPASALLSGILTKTGIFGVLVTSCNLFLYDEKWGKLILGIGVITMLGGAILAVFSVDLKRTLACSSMSQIEFILVGVGMQGLLAEENALAVHGTFLHMINHSLIKLVLFMIAGAVFMNTHALDLNTIRGFGRKKPFLMVTFLIGALAIGGIPGFGGYVSKTLLHESIVEYGTSGVMQWVEYLFLFSGGLTLAYMTKLFVAIFVEKNTDVLLQKKYDANKKYMGARSIFAIGGSALLLLIWGICPNKLMDRAANIGESFMQFFGHGHEVHYFTWVNLKGAVISVLIGALVYALVVRLLLMKKECNARFYVDAWPKWLDIENLIYRPLLLGAFPVIFGILSRILDSFVDTVVVLLRKTIYKDAKLPHERTEGNFITEAIGKLLNLIQEVRYRILKKEDAGKKNYVHIMAHIGDEISENLTMIQRSLSFGLFMFGVGLTLVFIYIILV